MTREQGQPEVSTGDVELVLRRAAEIEARSTGAEGAVGERDVVQLAEELGISRDAVDRALVELRAGALEPQNRPRGVGGRLWAPRQVACVRTVPGPAAEVEERVRELLRSQHFAIKRNFGTELLWKHDRSPWQALRSVFDASVQKLEGCSEVTTSVEETDRPDRVRVVIRLDLGELRSSSRASAIGGGVTFGGMVLGASALTAVFAGLLWLPVGALAAAGIGYGFTRKAVSRYRKQTALLEENVEGFLDLLEHDRPALPPPG